MRGTSGTWDADGIGTLHLAHLEFQSQHLTLLPVSKFLVFIYALTKTQFFNFPAEPELAAGSVSAGVSS